MVYEKQTEAIRNCCKTLLKQDKVDVVLGYTQSSLDELLIPFFVRKVEDIDKLAWGDQCWQNLAPYLHSRKDRVGIVAKPCDVRGIVQYIAEGQLNRDQVYIIGVDCAGMIDEEGNPRPGCDECRVHAPPLFDTHITDDRIPQIKAAEKKSETVQQKHTAERFQTEIDKCILCYACRQACYGCYCKTCFMERGTPDWLPAEIDSAAKKTFHMSKAMHLAGRCVECGACEAACASGVELRYIIKELTDFVEDNYDFQAGMDLSAVSPMVSYGDGDKEIGFLGGDEA
ncbi:MAG: hypothetical protein FWD03_07550 [Defluviitaleaceae bacterium]|nr:hypothetical protein [Defluviitaleaceae bacterium]